MDNTFESLRLNSLNKFNEIIDWTNSNGLHTDRRSLCVNGLNYVFHFQRKNKCNNKKQSALVVKAF